MKINAIANAVHNPLNCPCRDCDERNAECHSKCSLYREWRTILNDKSQGAKKVWSLR